MDQGEVDRPETAVFSIATLPDIVFIREGKRETLALSRSGRVIARLAADIAQRFPGSGAIGLIMPTSPALVLYWFAALAAGREPVILQYPTKKQGLDYWLASMRHSAAAAGLAGLVCDGRLAATGVAALAPALWAEETPTAGEKGCDEIAAGSIIQLSSGTTGHRKPIRLPLDDLVRHAANYNAVLGLGPGDRVVSWLPLYHDMGFVACFVMPLLLGVPVVMIDPMSWVQDRSLLFAAIEEFGGTVCFMPNFGFEVMAREGGGYSLATMRKWVSAGEPCHADTVRRFCAATGTDPTLVCALYGMAENVFAISQSEGFKTATRLGREYVSCGRPIPNTEVKVVDGEFHVRSDTSIRSYLGQAEFVDAAGFYASGDEGFLKDGELFVAGRRQDMMIQAGRKFFLGELDLLLNEAVPDCGGRGVCLAHHDAAIGTQQLIVLLERERLTDAAEHRRVAEALAATLPVESFALHFVPPEFITKTSSGKINRVKTLEDFLRMERWAERQGAKLEEERVEQELKRHFKGCLFDEPIAKALDSLGLVILDVVAKAHGLEVTKSMSLNDVIAQFNAKSGKRREEQSEDVVYIVTLMDYPITGRFTPTDLELIRQRTGLKIRLEHVCAPPAPVILHDLIFCDYFLCRDYDWRYQPYFESVNKIRNASLLLMDDHAEFAVGSAGAFPLMSRRFQRGPVADFMAYRWQKYAANHHLLPVGDALWGPDVTADEHHRAMADISAYLGVPIFRAAVCDNYRAHTGDWEYRDYYYHFDYLQVFQEDYSNHHLLVEALIDFINANREAIPRRRMPDTGGFPGYGDLWHFCACCVHPAAVEKVVATFDRLLIQGHPCSVPYLGKRLAELGKTFSYAPSLDSRGGFGRVPDGEWDCIVQTGGWGIPSTLLPVIGLMSAGGPVLANLPPDLALTEGELGIRPIDLKAYLVVT